MQEKYMDRRNDLFEKARTTLNACAVHLDRALANAPEHHRKQALALKTQTRHLLNEIERRRKAKGPELTARELQTFEKILHTLSTKIPK
jgi:hypothetical protein